MSIRDAVRKALKSYQWPILMDNLLVALVCLAAHVRTCRDAPLQRARASSGTKRQYASEQPQMGLYGMVQCLVERDELTNQVTNQC